jgi:hypothetical protein
MFASLGFEGAVDRLLNFEAVDDSQANVAISQPRAITPLCSTLRAHHSVTPS